MNIQFWILFVSFCFWSQLGGHNTLDFDTNVNQVFIKSTGLVKYISGSISLELSDNH